MMKSTVRRARFLSRAKKRKRLQFWHENKRYVLRGSFDFLINLSLISLIIFLAGVPLEQWEIYANGCAIAFAMAYFRSLFFISPARVGLFLGAALFLYFNLWMRFAGSS